MKEAASQLLAECEAVCLDCDGVIWKGDKPVPGTVETLNKLVAMGRKLLFVTNNSTKSRKEYRCKFDGIGLDFRVEETDVVTATFAVAEFLRVRTPHVKRVLVIGSVGLCDEIAQAGIEVVSGSAAPTIGSDRDFMAIKPDENIDAVVCGCDFGLTFSKMAYACLALQKNPEALFVATSADTFDNLGDRRIPGMTAVLSGITACTGIKPTICGKPNGWLAKHILSLHDLADSRKVCMVGDRLDSDMLFGKNGDMRTLLVLSGVTSPEEADAIPADHPARPEAILPRLGDVLL